nr:MAG TPA: hypothetical protein [Caudoviricetes sp.]
MWQWNDGTGELYHYGVLGMKWGHHKAKVYTAKANRARARGNMGDAQMYTAKARKATAKTERLGGGKAASQRVKRQSAGKTAAQVALFGTYGAMKYNQARAKHASRGKAAAKATLYNVGNKMTGGLLGVVEPRVSSRNKKSSGASAANTSTRKASISRTAKKSYTEKQYVAAHNRAAAKINDSSNHILSDFNKKWEGKYNTTAYQQAYTEMFNKMIEDELR